MASNCPITSSPKCYYPITKTMHNLDPTHIPAGYPLYPNIQSVAFILQNIPNFSHSYPVSLFMLCLLFRKHFLLSTSKIFSSPQSPSLISLPFENPTQHLSLLWPPVTSWWYHANYHIIGIITTWIFLCDSFGIVCSLSTRTMSNSPVVSNFLNPPTQPRTCPIKWHLIMFV